MKARVAGIAGSVLALTVIGGFAAASTFQPVADVSTPTATATSTPTETATVEPVVVPTTEAPAPVESTQAPAPVAAPKKVVVVPQVVDPAPVFTPSGDPALVPQVQPNPVHAFGQGGPGSPVVPTPAAS